MQSVLVTGGAGFIGSHLCEKLLAKQCRVTCLDNFDPFYPEEQKRQNVQSALENPSFRLIEGDIRDSGSVDAALDGCEAVIHLAACAGVRPSLEEPVRYTDINLTGTVSLLDGCVRAGVKKFVFGSSSSVYGNNRKVPFSEKDPVEHPISPYAASKRAGELYCHTFHHLYGIEVNCLRFFTVYGPRQRPDLAIHKFTRRIHAGEPIEMYGDGTSQRDYTYIDDILDGVLKSLQNCSGFEIYNLGESRTVPLHFLIELIERSLGRKAEIERKPMQPGDVAITFADISKARSQLQYAPQVDIETGIRKFVEWFQNVQQCESQCGKE